MSDNQNPNKNNEVTVTYDLVTPHSNHSIEFLIAAIRSNQYKMVVHTVRQLVAAGNKHAANEVKKYLPAATFSCQYKTRRCLDNVTHYNGFVLLDADGLTISALVRIVAMLPSCPCVYAFFISPSGNGIKILIKTNGQQLHHLYTYTEVMNYFSRLLHIRFDAHNSDMVRLCFLSHDPNAYLNINAEVFEVLPPVAPSPVLHSFVRPLPSLGTDVNDYVFRKCVRFTNRKRQFTEGNRNNFVFLLSCYCRMNGLSKEDALNEILQHYNFSQREIQSAVRSAYKYK